MGSMAHGVGGPSLSSGIGGGGGGGGGGDGGSGNEGGGGGRSEPCGACKFLRRKCINGCIFAPHFDSEQGVTKFEMVHTVFGASKIAKLLDEIPQHKRPDAIFSICYEAQARICDPVYGCSNQILALQEQVWNLQAELTNMQIRLAEMELARQSTFVGEPHISIASTFPVYNLPASSNILATINPSSLSDLQTQSQLASQQQVQHQQLHQQQFVQEGGSVMGNSNDLLALESELMYGVTGVAPPLQDTYQ